MKKIILAVLVLVGLVSFGNASCTEKNTFKSISVTAEKVEIFEIEVLDIDELITFPKCGTNDYVEGSNSKIKLLGRKFKNYERYQLKTYFDLVLDQRGKFIVFSSKKKISKKDQTKLLEENDITEYYVFLDEE